MLKIRDTNRVGFNDGLIYPGNFFPLGTSADRVRGVAAERAPARGTVNVVVVLVDFSDEQFAANHDQAYYNDLFFSEGVLANGSVKEYFDDVTDGLVTIAGQVVGPYRMPDTLVNYANGGSGTDNTTPNARDLARDAATAANPDVDYSVYDNDGDGFVDAFIVVQAGPGAESTGSADQIWSHKWVLRSAYNADGTKIYGYLVVPEESRIGVCCHELGHLLFGFPDLYDTDYSGSGIGDWCLMAGGSWNGNGDIPAHPSAWCKANQEWVTVINQTSNSVESIADVKTSKTVYRLWKDGAAGNEYFLLENRQQTGYDRHIPGAGLLIWHVDDSISSNADEVHPKVALMQADGLRDLEDGNDQGDGGDAYPGSTNNVAFNDSSTPNSRSYGNVGTCVAVESVGASGAVMSALLKVKCPIVKPIREKRPKELRKEHKEIKEFRKEKEKELKERKELKELKEKELKEFKEKELKEFKEKELKEFKEKEGEGGGGLLGGGAQPHLERPLDERVADLERRFEELTPFIGPELRPELRYGALAEEDEVSRVAALMAQRSAAARSAARNAAARSAKAPGRETPGDGGKKDAAPKAARKRRRR
jgi:immune inhibitor A